MEAEEKRNITKKRTINYKAICIDAKNIDKLNKGTINELKKINNICKNLKWRFPYRKSLKDVYFKNQSSLNKFRQTFKETIGPEN